MFQFTKDLGLFLNFSLVFRNKVFHNQPIFTVEITHLLLNENVSNKFKVQASRHPNKLGCLQ